MGPKAARRNRNNARPWESSGRRQGGIPAGEHPAAQKLGASCWVETATRGSAAYMTVIGELDMSCKDRFRDHLKTQAAGRPKHFVLDLRSVTFLDSTGIALLLTARATAEQEPFELHVVRSSTEIVQAVFDAAGVTKLLPLCDEPPRLGA